MRLNKAFLFYVLIAFFYVTSCTSQNKDKTAPNIIIFLVDDMGLMDTSVPFLTDANGTLKKHPLNDFYRTPNLKKLANQGSLFTNFYAHSVCSPSRTSILTGQNSARHRVTNWVHPEWNNRTKFGPTDWNWKGLTKESVTLPRLLQREGYKTIHIGKAHFGPLHSNAENPLNLGFDVNIAGNAIGQPGSYLGTEGFGHIKGDKKRAVPSLEKYHGKDIFLTEALTLEAKLAISQAKEAGKPFFLNMAHYAVHAPFYSDPRFKEHYVNSGKSKNAQAYATLIEGIDKSLGDIIQHVKKLGLGENTLLLFLGDNGSDAPLPIENGYSSSSPLKGKKANHWEGGMRTPFIAAWVTPNKTVSSQIKLPIAQQSTQQQLASILDIFPTLCDVANVTYPKSHVIDGFSLNRQLNNQKNEERNELFLNHFPHEHRSSYFTSLVKANWKIIYHYQPQGLPRYELFNLKEDPYEASNLADTNSEQLKVMMTVLIDELKSKKALYPEKDKLPMQPIMPN
ncbi:sulfatase-like hydrolase/transferase [Polaribacter sp. IC073]|uniref:sulfatase-like hydrolase/transferase n=1 Tax=Polaribacter sp. IC073 TaxID=2508540 RepID=UPI0011BE7E17|nr:sulfatase-like hydrolase/transferase [Polaribacter sp. IC073]TXD46508.1 sulfatase-like hydrolase/transferase [Polaribacter sp. IC073]